MKLNWKHGLGAVFAIALFTEPAFANTISALYLMGGLYLFAGNAVIGLFEGSLLARFFKTQRSKSIGIAIFANYASAWLGILQVISLSRHFQDIPLESVKTLLLAAFVLAFIGTLLIEYPFVWLLFRNRPNSYWEAAKANFTIQSISYLLLYLFFLPYSPTGLATNLQFVPFSELQPTENYALYFITPDNQQVMRSRLDGMPPELIQDIPPLNFTELPKLCFHPAAQKTFDLFLESSSSRHRILADFATRIPTFLPEEDPIECSILSFSFGPVPSLSNRNAITEGYHTTVDEAIIGRSISGKPDFRYSLETPVIRRKIRFATQLKNELVILQIGENEIYLLHPYEKKIAKVARGFSPLVVIPK